MGAPIPEPVESVAAWLLHRVARAVEAGEVTANLLTELQGEFEATKDLSQEEGHARAVRDLAEQLGIPLEEVERGLSALEAQAGVTRELFMRRIAEAWLEGQRRAYRVDRG